MKNRMGTVFLRVANLQKQLAFYENVIGLKAHRHEDDTVFLGTDEDDLLALIHTPNNTSRRGQNGLYHFALLLPSRYHLALTLRHFMVTKTPLQGLSDHIVSEAIYLADPEGNGIEIYADRPREKWYVNGQFQLDTLPLDVTDLMTELKTVNDEKFQLATGTIMGHVHLHVDSVLDAIGFYQDVMGMQVMFQMPTAGFLSYDGYHHHLGVNTWAGKVHHSKDMLGLDHFVIFMNEAQKKHLRDQYPTDDNEWRINDPSTNVMLIKSLD